MGILDLCPQDLETPTQLNMGKSSKMILAGAAALAVYKLGQQTFVPAPAARAPVSAGAIATLGAAPAFADKIDDAAKKLSEASYPFIKEIDWTSDVYAKLPTQGPLEVLKAIDKMLVMGAAMDPAALKAGVWLTARQSRTLMARV